MEILISKIPNNDCDVPLISLFKEKTEIELYKEKTKKLFSFLEEEGEKSFFMMFNTEFEFTQKIIFSYFQETKIITEDELSVLKKFEVDKLDVVDLKYIIDNQLEEYMEFN